MKPLNFRETFLPDKILAISELIIAVLLVFCGVLLWQVNSYLSFLGQISIQENFIQNFDLFQRTAFDATIAGRITAGVFWAIFGMVIYIAYWAIHNLIVNFHNHKIINATYVNPKPNNENDKQYHRIIAAKMLAYGSLILLPLYIISAFRTIYPLAIQLGSFFIRYPTASSGPKAGMLAVLITVVTLHVGVIIYRMAFGKYSVI